MRILTSQQWLPYLANGPWHKSLNFIFPTKYVIPKSLKFSHWPSNLLFRTQIPAEYRFKPFHWRVSWFFLGMLNFLTWGTLNISQSLNCLWIFGASFSLLKSPIWGDLNQFAQELWSLRTFTESRGILWDSGNEDVSSLEIRLNILFQPKTMESLCIIYIYMYTNCYWGRLHFLQPLTPWPNSIFVERNACWVGSQKGSMGDAMTLRGYPS